MKLIRKKKKLVFQLKSIVFLYHSVLYSKYCDIGAWKLW